MSNYARMGLQSPEESVMIFAIIIIGLLVLFALALYKDIDCGFGPVVDDGEEY